MFVHFVLGWATNFVGIVKGRRVAKSLRTPALELESRSNPLRIQQVF